MPPSLRHGLSETDLRPWFRKRLPRRLGLEASHAESSSVGASRPPLERGHHLRGQSPRRGDTDVSMVTWVNNIQAVGDEAIEEGTVIGLGRNFPSAPPCRYAPTRLKQAPAQQRRALSA